MTLSQKDIDGKYTIKTIYDCYGPYPLESEGETEIVGGFNDRYDRKGCHWITKLTVVNDDAVKFETTVDPLEADDDVMLVGPHGRPTREPVDCAATLEIENKDGRLRFFGYMTQGRVKTVVRMTKI